MSNENRENKQNIASITAYLTRITVLIKRIEISQSKEAKIIVLLLKRIAVKQVTITQLEARIKQLENAK